MHNTDDYNEMTFISRIMIGISAAEGIFSDDRQSVKIFIKHVIGVKKRIHKSYFQSHNSNIFVIFQVFYLIFKSKVKGKVTFLLFEG